MEGKEKVENMWVTFNRGRINHQESEENSEITDARKKWRILLVLLTEIM